MITPLLPSRSSSVSSLRPSDSAASQISKALQTIFFYYAARHIESIALNLLLLKTHLHLHSTDTGTGIKNAFFAGFTRSRGISPILLQRPCRNIQRRHESAVGISSTAASLAALDWPAHHSRPWPHAGRPPPTPSDPPPARRTGPSRIVSAPRRLRDGCYAAMQ